MALLRTKPDFDKSLIPVFTILTHIFKLNSSYSQMFYHHLVLNLRAFLWIGVDFSPTLSQQNTSIHSQHASMPAV